MTKRAIDFALGYALVTFMGSTGGMLHRHLAMEELNRAKPDWVDFVAHLSLSAMFFGFPSLIFVLWLNRKLKKQYQRSSCDQQEERTR